MIDVIRQILTYLVSHYALYLVVTMGCIVSITIGLLTLIKKPIKKLTTKYIKNEKLRTLAHKTFIFLAFAISTLIWAILYLFAPSYFPMQAVEILLTGAFSIVIYALGDGIITKSKAEQLVEQITDIKDDSKDNKEKPKDTDAVKEYIKKFKK